jgi:endoglucanase
MFRLRGDREIFVRSVLTAGLVVLNLSFSTSPLLSGEIAAVAGEPTGVRTLFVGRDSPARRQADAWRSSRPDEASLMDLLAEQPVAYWFDATDESVYESVQSVVRAAAKHASIPVLVAYNIPSRDCGGYSAGGARSEADYIAWVSSFANAIGNNGAIVILEPDALADRRCLSTKAENRRESLLSQAITILKRGNPNASVYLDAGNPNWVAAEEMATRLQRVGIQRADGFALNVSNFETTKDNIEYGTRISQLLDGKHFVVDTSRNGLGSNGDWCNPPGRAIGERPTLSTGHPLVDAFLWIKIPGESDGTCHGGPRAGEWWPDYALGLVERAPAIGDLRRP